MLPPGRRGLALGHEGPQQGVDLLGREGGGEQPLKPGPTPAPWGRCEDLPPGRGIEPACGGRRAPLRRSPLRLGRCGGRLLVVDGVLGEPSPMSQALAGQPPRQCPEVRPVRSKRVSGESGFHRIASRKSAMGAARPAERDRVEIPAPPHLGASGRRGKGGASGTREPPSVARGRSRFFDAAKPVLAATSWPMVSASEGHEPNPGRLRPPCNLLLRAVPPGSGTRRSSVVAGSSGSIWGRGRSSHGSTAPRGRPRSAAARTASRGIGSPVSSGWDSCSISTTARPSGRAPAHRGCCGRALPRGSLPLRAHRQDPGGSTPVPHGPGAHPRGGPGQPLRQPFFEPHPAQRVRGRPAFRPGSRLHRRVLHGLGLALPDLQRGGFLHHGGSVVLLLLSGFFGGDGPAETEKAGESVQPG